MADDHDDPFAGDDFPGFPRIGDTAFHATYEPSDPRSRYDAIIRGHSPMAQLLLGYRQAADALYAAIEKWVGFGMLDSLVFPYVFLWRHFLELSLKDLVISYWHVEGTNPRHKDNNWIFKSHDLRRIWGALRPMVQRHGGVDKENVEAMGRLIAEFAKYDGGSYTFRYAHDTSGRPSHGSLPKRINLATMQEVMGRVSAFLDGADGYVSEMIAARGTDL